MKQKMKIMRDSLIRRRMSFVKKVEGEICTPPIKAMTAKEWIRINLMDTETEVLTALDELEKEEASWDRTQDARYNQEREMLTREQEDQKERENTTS